MAKYQIITIIFTLIPWISICQVIDTTKIENNQVYIDVRTPIPQYPGGKDSLRSFICDNINRSRIDSLNLNGLAVFEMKINREGNVTELNVVRLPTKLFKPKEILNEEFTQVCLNMPNWTFGEEPHDELRRINISITLPLEKYGCP